MITVYKGNIKRDWSVRTPNVYADSGQDCGTVWFYSVSQARKMITAYGDRVPHGSDIGRCDQCRAGLKGTDPVYADSPHFACRAWKRALVERRGSSLSPA